MKAFLPPDREKEPVYLDPFPPYPGDAWMVEGLPQAPELPLLARVWPQPETCIVLGRGCRAETDICLEQAEADKIPIYRREGGGGTVVLSEGMLIIAVVARVRDPFANRRYFGEIQAPICEALAEVGLPSVTQRGLSDLAVGDRKILGSSLRRQQALLLYQAVLLVDADRSLFEMYLRHPPREPDYRQGREHRAFTVTLREIGLSLPLRDLQASLQRHLDAELPKRLHPDFLW